MAATANNMRIERKSDNGIYGIFIIDPIYQKEELIYIGKTKSSFKSRFENHRRRMNDLTYKKQKLLYDTIRNAKKMGMDVQMMPLLTLDQLHLGGNEISERTLNAMELTLITLYRPRCNVEGLERAYGGWL